MNVSWLLVASIIVQLAACVAALRMAGTGSKKLGWLVLSAAFLTMAVRRFVTLDFVLGLAPGWNLGLPAQELVSLLTSILMLTGVLLMRPFFRKAEEDSISASRLGAAIEGSEQKYRFIVSHILEALVVLRDGRLVFASPAFSRVFAVAIDEMIGKGLSNLVAAGDRERVSKALDAGVSGSRETRTVEAEIVRRDGSHGWVRIVAYPAEWEGLSVMVGLVADITQHRLAEARLRESEERYRAMFNATNAVKVLIDPDTGGVVDANAAACAFYGWSREELKDPEVAARISTLSRSEGLRALALARTREASSFSLKQRTASGEIRNVQVNASPVELHGRSFLYAVIVDVTDRVEAEKARDRLVHYLRAAADVAARLLATADPRAITREILETLGDAAGADRCYWFEIHQTSSGGLVASQREEWCAEGVRPQADDTALQEMRLDTELARASSVLARGDVVTGSIGELDRETWGFLQAFGVSSVLLIPLIRQGKLDGVIGFDALTDRQWRVAEIDLLRAAAQAFSLALDRHDHENRRRELASIVEQAAETIILTDAEGLIRYVNSAFTRSAGRSLSEVSGSPVQSLHAGPAAGGFSQAVGQTLAAGQPWRGITHDQGPSGLLIRFQTTVFPLFDERRNVTGACVLQLDVSEQTQLEEKLRRAQRMEALGSFAGGIAHDFNNLVTVISGAAELLLRQSGQNEASQAEVEVIQRAATSATELTRGLLAFARRQVLMPTVLDLREIVEQTLPMLRRLLPSSIEVRTDLDEAGGLVRADRGSLEQALLNLCINARDAMPSGGMLTLSVQPRPIGPDYAQSHPWARVGPYVGLTVEDTGTGIGQDDLQHVFDPFFTTKEPGRGTGLGLAIVYGVAKELEGFVDVTSELGRGSRFSIYLPEVEAQVEVAPPTRGRGALKGNEHVLLAEDHEDLRELVARYLRTYGYSVTEAADGEQAFAVLEAQAHRIDAVVTDMEMPRMGGRPLFELTRARWPRIPFVLTTGFAEQARNGGLARQPGLVFVAKPYAVEGLISSMREVLDERTRLDEAESGRAPGGDA